MQTVSAKISQVFSLTIGNTVVSVLNLLAAPFLVRWLSPVDFGSYNQVIMVCLVFQTVATFSLHGAVTSLLSRFDDKRSLVVSTCIRLFFISSIFVSLVYLAAADLVSELFSNPGISSILPIATFYITGQAILPVLNAILIFHGHVRRSVLLNVIFTCVRIVLMFGIIHGFSDLYFLFFVIGIISWIHAIFLYFSIPSDARQLTGFDAEVARSAILISRPLTLSSFVERLLYNIDGFTVSVFLSAGTYAFYKAGAIDVPLIASLGSAAFSVALPHIAQLFRDGCRTEIVRVKRTIMTSIAFFTYPVLVFLLFFHREIIGFYLTSHYLPAALVFAVYNLVILLKVFDWQDVIVLSGNSRSILLYTVLALLLNMILCPVFVLYHGYIGAAIAFVISLFFLGYLQLRKISLILECSAFDLLNLRVILGIILTSVVVAFVFKYLGDFYQLQDLTNCLLFIPFIVITLWINKRFGYLPHEINTYLLDRFPYIKYFT